MNLTLRVILVAIAVVLFVMAAFKKPRVDIDWQALGFAAVAASLVA